jgi:beta-lactamase regulating signal transducer with metallopeptidase domain
MIEALDRASAALVWILATSAARSFVLAGIAAAALAAFRSRTTSLRLLTWTSVLYASLALPLLGGLVPPLDVRTPEFVKQRMTAIRMDNAGKPQRVTSFATHSTVSREFEPAKSYGTVANKRTPVVPGVRERTSALRLAQHWKAITAAIYLLVTLFFLARFAAGIAWSSKLLRDSETITDSSAVAKLASLSGHHFPRLAASERIYVPLTVGALQATILLPSDWREWEGEKLDAVLAHELSHVERRDAMTQCCAVLYRAIFWFNPLAWWLNRHLAALAEQASDEAVLSGGIDRKNYARTLLQFFRVLQTAPGRIRWEGVSLATAGEAEERVERILEWKGTVTMNVKRSIAAAILVLAVPVVYLAAAVRPGQVIPAPSNADIAQQPGTPPAPPAAPVGGVSAIAPVAGVPAVGPIAPMAPVAPVAPTAQMAFVGPGASDHKGFSYHYGFDDEERFIIVSGKSDSFTMSGSTQDARHVEKLKKQIPGDFIWFQRDEKSYIIRDQATVDRARGLWAPQEELGRKQEELGKQQEELGRQQEELGNRMEQVQVKVPDMTAELDRLKAKLQKLGPSATMEQIGDLQSEIGELQSKLGEIQSQAGEQQGKLGEQQGALGEKQGKLGEQQGELGRQQAELAEKATSQMKELLDEAIKNGTAKPEEEIVKNPTL